MRVYVESRVTLVLGLWNRTVESGRLRPTTDKEPETKDDDVRTRSPCKRSKKGVCRQG